MDTHRTENAQITIIKWWSRCECKRIQRNAKNNFIALRNRVLKIKKIKIQLSFVNFAKSSKKFKKLFSAKSG